MPLPRRQLVLFSLLSILRPVAAGEGSCRDDEDLGSCEPPPPPKSCRLFLAPRGGSQNNYASDGSGRKLGIFAARDFPRGMPLTPRSGGMVLHLIDVDPYISNEDEARSISQLGKWLSHGFLQDVIASGHGGNHEGVGKVLTALPGVGMLAASPRPSDRPNVWAGLPETDEANMPRNQSPLAGSFALHYNLTHVVTSRDGVGIGEEVLVDRDGWYRRKALGGNDTTLSEEETTPQPNHHLDAQQLFQDGICLDNLHVGMSSHGYGRGAFASRFLEKGSIVAPVPVLPIPRRELRYVRSKEWKKAKTYRQQMKKEKGLEEANVDGMLPPNMEWREQLLLNYCLGHQNSSVLLFPYGLAVNYVNHAPAINSGEPNGPMTNVELRWSEKLSQKDSAIDPRTLSPARLWNEPNPEGMVLEMVALRDIQPDEEVLLDYGSVWRQAWETHEQRWNDDPANKNEGNAMEDDYSPAYITEDVVSNLRTAEEQVQYPYPANVFTACFYRYQRDDDGSETDAKPQQSKKQTEAIPWKMSAGLFDMIHLRPCKVVARDPAAGRDAPPQQQPPGQGKMFYTAIVQNRPGLAPREKIPKGEKLIVSGIPREAFRFADRPYTSDVHLEGAFRQNIGLEDTGIFPEAWLDLKGP